MHEVVPDRLWIGNAKDAEETSRLLNCGVAAMVCLATEELPPRMTREMIFYRFPLVDGGENSAGLLRMAVHAVSSLLREQIPCFVYCCAGMSRSLVITSAAFAIVQELEIDKSMQALFVGLPHDVSPQLWQDVKTACSQSTPNNLVS